MPICVNLDGALKPGAKRLGEGGVPHSLASNTPLDLADRDG
jgi:hypothetical protein